MLTSFLIFLCLFMISKQEDTGEVRMFLVCTRNEISEISETSKSVKICKFELNSKLYKSVFNGFYVKGITYRIKENEEKKAEVKDSNGDVLFNINMSLFRNDDGLSQNKVEFVNIKVDKTTTILKDGIESDVYIVENDNHLREKLGIILKFVVMGGKIPVFYDKTEIFFEQIKELLMVQIILFRNYSQESVSKVKVYNELNIKLRLLCYIMMDYHLFGLPVNDSYDSKLFLKKSKIFSNQKLKNITYLNMAIITEMESLISETEKIVLETNFIEDKQELLFDLKKIKDQLTSIHKDFKKLNEEIVDFKVDSYSEEEFIAKKIIYSIDEYLCNREKHNEKLLDKSGRDSIIFENSLKYNDVAQEYLKEFKLLISDISFNEEIFIRNSSAPNCPSDSQSLEMETIEEKTEIDEIEAAIDNSLLDIIKHVQTGRQWYVKEYEESD